MRGSVRHVLIALCGALALAACGNPLGEPSDPVPSPLPSFGDHFATGSQPLEKLPPGIAELVDEELIGPDVDVDGVEPVQLNSPYMDTVLSEVCGNSSGNGVYETAYGERREWKGQDLEIQHFVSLFGVITAAQAVEQVRSKLTACSTYRLRDGDRRLLGERELPPLDKVGGRLMFCETVNEKDPEPAPKHLCVAFVTRAEFASRIEVRAKTLEQAERLTKQLIALAAQRLAT